MRVKPPPSLVYCVPLRFRPAYCVFPNLGLTYCVPFNNKNKVFVIFKGVADPKLSLLTKWFQGVISPS